MERLPEQLISQLLSYLPTREAVRTSTLASEWKHRWRSIENLDLDNYDINFANIVMLQLKFIALNKLRLRCVQSHEISVINEVIYESLSRGVKELDLHISLAKTRSLACGIFTCHTLAVLKLCVHTLDVPVSVRLPNLIVLHLEYIKFKDDKSISRLFSSCPVLEELALISCGLKDKYVLEISNPVLKKLVLNRNGYYKVKYSFVLDAPNLEYLEFSDYIPQQFTVKNLHSLVEARVNFETYRVRLSSGNSVLTKSVTEFVHVISNVRSLHLSSDFTKAFIRCRIKLPLFLKLTRLEYEIDDIAGCFLLGDLIESSPGVESIVLNFNNRFVPREYIPAGVWDRLRGVKRTLFIGNKEDLQFVKYILRNAKVLERLDLHSAELYEVSTKEYENVTKSAELVEVKTEEYEKARKKLSIIRRANAKVLDRLDLHSVELYEVNTEEHEYATKSAELDEVSTKEYENAIKKLLTFRKASKICKIVIH